MKTIQENFSSKEYQLTEGEALFIKEFLSNNDCDARDVDTLLGDNFSCQSFEELVKIFSNLSEPQIKGYLGSLIEKQVIFLEDDRRDAYATLFQIKGKKYKKLPDLYWVDDSYLESLNSEVSF